jgi:hypothetical protein
MTKRGIRLLSFPALVLSIALFARPGFAAHTRSTAHIPDDPAGKSCSRAGLPCSTAPVVAPLGLKSEGSQHELDQIERSGLNVFRGSSAPKNAPVYRPSAISRSDRSAPINFTYRPPSSGGGGATRSAGKAR